MIRVFASRKPFTKALTRQAPTIKNTSVRQSTDVLNVIMAAFMALGLVACGGGSSSTTTTTTTNNTTDTESEGTESAGTESTSTGLTLSGTAVATSADVAAVATRWEKLEGWLAQYLPTSTLHAAQATGAAANTALPNATVNLYRISGGGTASAQIDIGTVTTDASGDYTISEVTESPEGSGQDSDFYYEVRITKGDLTLVSPVSPQADTTVNVSPETDLAAKILSDVLEVPSDDTPPVPSASLIESTRELVIQNAGDLIGGDKIGLPSAVGASNQDEILAAANGIAAGGGNAEKAFKAASFESEYYALSAQGVNASSAEVSGYLSRLVSEGCNQSGQNNFPQPVAELMAERFKTGTTVTVSAIIAAYNNHFTGTPLVSDTVIAEYDSMLTNIGNNQGTAANTVSDISNNDLLGLMAKRDLDAAGFSGDSALTMDQAAAFIQVLGGTNCALEGQLDLYGFIGELLGDSGFAVPRISGFEIYHNSGFGCNEGSGDGHFVADVGVYSGGKTLTSVVVNSTDTNALGGDGTETLTAQGNRFVSNTNGVCVALGTAVTYTITANFNDGSSATRQVERNHPRIPEASSQVLVDGAFVNGADNGGSPTVVDSPRPLYQWTSPADMETAIANDSANTAVSESLAASSARVKYTYEFSHVDLTGSPISPASQCDSVPSGRLYSVDSFIPTVDCDVSACATALGINASDVGCRINIQSFYVDRQDKLLGQAAGHFRFFCVDTDNDDACG